MERDHAKILRQRNRRACGDSQHIRLRRNWIEDLAVIRLVPYNQFVANVSDSAQIAYGTAIGLRQVLGMRDGTVSLESFFERRRVASR
jgi:hypothetical protein